MTLAEKIKHPNILDTLQSSQKNKYLKIKKQGSKKRNYRNSTHHTNNFLLKNNIY